MKINFFTQDSTVFPFLPISLPGKKAGTGPSDSRIAVVDRPEFPAAKSDKNGNFLYRPEQPQFDACQPYGVLKLGMKLYSTILERELPFAFQGKIQIFPHDDEGINAYYSRGDHGVHFLYYNNPVLKKELEMAQSLDVGAHEENGHLLLDGLRPEYLNFELESQAFHEAFGDISSMILALQFDQVVDRLLQETKGDLGRSNVVSRLGEEAGAAMQALSGYPKKNHNFLRDAVHTMKYDWKYVDPGLLQDWSPEDEKRLGAEPHNFSRLFSGIWYEIFAELFNKDPQKSKNPKQAVKNSCNVAARLIVRAVADFAPDTTACYGEIAKGMLEADAVDWKGTYHDLLTEIFQKRNILPKSRKAFAPLPGIKLRKPMITRKDAIIFLEKNKKKLGLEKTLLLEPAEDFPKGHKRFVYRNKKGETFLTFHSSQDFSLHGSLYRELEGAEYRIKGCLKLGFDKKGNLMTCSTDFVTREKRERIERNIRQLLENEHVKMLGLPVSGTEMGENFFKKTKHHKIPYLAYTAWKQGKMVLERVPIFT